MLVGDDTVDIAAGAGGADPWLRLLIQDLRTRRPRPSEAAEFVLDRMLPQEAAHAVKQAVFGRAHFARTECTLAAVDSRRLLGLVRAGRIHEAIELAELSDAVVQLAARCIHGVDVIMGRVSKLLEGLVNHWVLALPMASDVEFTAMSLLCQCAVVKRLGGRYAWFVHELLRLGRD